ncbi:MAG: tetratricopeptide repeat protein [Chloroflexales bacterium]|nr:tetratricopeptide repeat protein [Chloroflexales bacterium]
MNDASFGAIVRRWRRALDLTQDELADQVGCGVSTLRKIEGDERRPSRQLAERLAACLRVPPEAHDRFLAAARGVVAAHRLDGIAVDAPTATPATLPTPTQSPPLPVIAPPTGTVTFLFTDIEGSTWLWEQHPDAMSVALAAHDALLHRAIAEHHGYTFKTVGDAFYAAFATAPDALRAALTAQRQLHAPLADLAIKVRMALHTGDAETRDDDYFGPPLNRVARLLSAGHGDQILLSHVTAELVRDRLPFDVTLRDLGEHRLRDLSRPERFHQVVAPGLRADFPSLRTLDALRTNLPAQLTSFVQREQEVATGCELLRRPEVRLLTLTGPGGVGKTRLGLQIAAELADTRRDGVYLVELASVRDPALVIPTIADILGVREEPGHPLDESLANALRTRQLLLVLDNFEQVIEAAPLITSLLTAVPQLQVLITSREALRVSGEHELPVAPLALPDPQHLPPLHALSHYAAVELFIQRAQAIQPGFTVTNDNAPAIAEICHRLDGLPLAIELAAMRVKLLSPQALLARLDHRLSLLTGGLRDLPARQQTLRNAIAWSYDLLTLAEQALFRRLAVCVDGCTLEAAEAVGHLADANPDILDGLSSLVDKSLLRQCEHYGEPRFVMLEIIREYAKDQLVSTGEEEAVQRQHAVFFLALAETAAPQLVRPAQRGWLERLDAEQNNLRAALEWALKHGEGEVALRLSGALWWFWWIRKHLSEGRAWLERALDQPAPSEPTAERTRARATALYRAGFLALFQGDMARTTVLGEESLALFQTLGDQRGIAWASYTLASGLQASPEDQRAMDLLSESLRLARALDEPLLAGWALNDMAAVSMRQGGYREAAQTFQEALALFERLGDTRDLAVCLNNLGAVAEALGDDRRAADLYAQSLTRFQELGDPGGLATCLMNLGRCAQRQGDSERAVSLLVESIRLWQQIGAPLYMAQALTGLGAVAGAKGQPLHAARLFGAAEAQQADWLTLVDPSDRTRFEQTVAAARAQADSATFAEAWAEGRNMPIEELIAGMSHYK